MEIQTNGMAEFLACLTKLKEAPRKGWLLAYTRTQVLFSRYEETGGDREQLAQLLEGSQLLELHIFCLLYTSFLLFPIKCIEAGKKRRHRSW